MNNAGVSSLLLETADVPPVHEHNATGRSPFLITCDHYGRLIPRALGELGLPESELRRHIAWDIGIAGVAEQLSDHLGAHLIAQRYSRLVIDCNRPPHVASSIPLISEATTIPGNEGLTREAAEARREKIFDPYHRRIDEIIDSRLHAGMPTMLVSMHSFTPVYAGIARPWHIGTLYHRDTVLPPLLLKALRNEGDLVVGDNEPYAVERRDRLHDSGSRRDARANEYRNRNPPGSDYRPGRREIMGRSAGADFCRYRSDDAGGETDLGQRRLRRTTGKIGGRVTLRLQDMFGDGVWHWINPSCYVDCRKAALDPVIGDET